MFRNQVDLALRSKWPIQQQLSRYFLNMVYIQYEKEYNTCDFYVETNILFIWLIELYDYARSISKTIWRRGKPQFSIL
jgi:hypothetical protein